MIDKMNPRSQLIIHMKTILISLIGAAISGRAFAAPEETRIPSCARSTVQNGNGGWSSSLGSKARPNPFLIIWRKWTQLRRIYACITGKRCCTSLTPFPRADLSQEEQINYDVYRPEIENFVANQKFRRL